MGAACGCHGVVKGEHKAALKMLVKAFEKNIPAVINALKAFKKSKEYPGYECGLFGGDPIQKALKKACTDGKKGTGRMSGKMNCQKYRERKQEFLDSINECEAKLIRAIKDVQIKTFAQCKIQTKALSEQMKETNRRFKEEQAKREKEYEDLTKIRRNLTKAAKKLNEMTGVFEVNLNLADGKFNNRQKHACMVN